MALVVVAARVMPVNRFGDFSLAYAGVLLASQLIRVSLGEASMVWASTSADVLDVAPVVLGAALSVTVVAGCAAGSLTLIISHSVAFAVATGLGVCLVSLADTTRYAILARARVRRALLFDLIWTVTELGGLALLWWRGDFSPALLLLIWVLSAALAVMSALGVVRPAGLIRSLVTVSGNPHWWRLAINEGIITGSSYVLLAVLGVAGGTAQVGAVRAALLPYLWVQLAISATWLVVLSRRPGPAQLRRFSRRVAEVVLGVIVLTLATVRLLPHKLGVRLLLERWDQVFSLAGYAASAYAILALAELIILQLKARAETAAVLRARLGGAATTACVAVVIFVSPSPRTALLGIVAGHGTVALLALRWARRTRQVATTGTVA